MLVWIRLKQHMYMNRLVQRLSENELGEVTQSCPTLCDPVDCSPLRLLCPWDSPGKNTGVGCHFLLQGIFLTQGSNPGLPHCRQTLYPLSRQGSPRAVVVLTTSSNISHIGYAFYQELQSDKCKAKILSKCLWKTILCHSEERPTSLG